MATDKQIDAAAEILRDMIDAPPSVTETLIKDALDAAERAAWEPIESAPVKKNILLFALTFEMDDGKRNWRMDAGWLDGNGDWNWGGRVVKDYEYKPTHWRPLPAPPAEEK